MVSAEERAPVADRLDRVLTWVHAVAAERAARRVAVPGGVALMHPDFPVVHNQNYLLLTEVSPGVDAASVNRAAEQTLGAAGVEHRVIEVHEPALIERLDAGLLGSGYRRSTDLLMWFRGPLPEPDRAEAPVVELGPDERCEIAAAWRMAEGPDWPEPIARQLGERARTILPVVHTTFLGVRDDAGEVVARTDLYQRDGIAQVEEVVTTPAAQNRGFASSLVRDAVRRAQTAGADLVFLVADADDWPADLYRRLGFEDLGRTALYIRSPE
jgi:ribosomal protein S18 acetylase RimI-like enzyme